MNEELITYEDLRTYETIVSRLADSKSDTIFYNTGTEHANIVLQNIFEQSKKSINILTGHLNSYVYSNDETLYHLEKFFLDGGQMKIIFDDFKSIDINSKIINLCKKYLNSLKIVSIPDKLDYHFLTCDNRMYRYEYDTDNYKAEFCFNNSLKVKDINNRFMELFNMAQQITFPQSAYQSLEVCY